MCHSLASFGLKKCLPITLKTLAIIAIATQLTQCNSKDKKITKEQQTPVRELPKNKEESLEKESSHTTDEAKQTAKKEAAEAARIAKEKRDLAKKAELKKYQVLVAQREQAWANFKGTKYDSLVVAGKTYNDVKVTDVNALGVTVSYEHGARRFKYPDLPQKIQELCHYDSEFSEKAIQLAEQRKSKLRAQYKKSIAQRKTETSSLVTPPRSQSRPVKQSSKTKEKSTTLKGNLTVKMTSSDSSSHRTYRSGRWYRTHYKNLKIKAISSVPAKVYDGDRVIKTISPMEVTEFTHRTGSDGKYWLELRTNSGKVLDKEAWNRKTGL